MLKRFRYKYCLFKIYFKVKFYIFIIYKKINFFKSLIKYIVNISLDFFFLRNFSFFLRSKILNKSILEGNLEY